MKLPDWLSRATGLMTKTAGAQTEFAVVLRGGVVVLGLQVLRAGLTFAALVVVARLTGAEQYGIFAFYFSLISMLALFGPLGLAAAAVRFVAQYREAGDWARLRGYLRFSTAVTAVAATAMALAAGAATARFGLGFGGAAPVLYWTAFATIPLLSLIRLQAQTARAFLWPWIFEGPARVFMPLFLLIGVTAIWIFGDRPTALDAVAVTAASALTIWLTLLFVLGRNLGPLLHRHRPVYETGLWAVTAGPMLASSSAGLVLRELDILLVGAFLTPQDVAVYQAAARVSMLAAMTIYAQNSFVGPRMAALFQSGRRDEAQHLLRRTVRLTLALTAALCLGLVLLGRPVLSLFGADFTAGYPVLIILLLSVLTTTSSGPLGLILNMTGHEKTAAAIMVLALVVNLALHSLLIPRFGIIGAALAVLAANILIRLLLLATVRAKVGLSPAAFSRARK